MLRLTSDKRVEAKKLLPQFWAPLGTSGASGATGYPQNGEVVAHVGINKRVSLRKFKDDIRRWVDEGRSDDWIASALGTSPSSVQSFRSRNAIYRRGATSTLYDPQDFSSYEGVLDPEGPGVWFDPEIRSDPHWHKRWSGTKRVELRLTPSRIVFLRRGGGGQANR
jgi:hypothetical protein